jgi:purine-binding chemotaxis protein CheW
MSTGLEICTFEIAGQLFGIDALEVQEIMPPQRITRVPLAAPGVAGLLNVRGELVTALDLRPALELPARDAAARPMNIVLRTVDGAVSLLVDGVGEVLSIDAGACEAVPPTLRGPARALAAGVVKLKHRLLLRLNTAAVLGSASSLSPASSPDL